MNDRYLFRGKRVDNGEWVVGSLGIIPDGRIEIGTKCIEPPDCDPMWQNVLITYDVIPETVGQCTGRSDKNKKKIYEGDILKGAWNTILVVYFDNCYLQFRVREVVSGKENDIDYYDNNNRTRIEVIGNIYDNPELLEVER